MRHALATLTLLLAGATRLLAASPEAELRGVVDQQRWQPGTAACESLPADEVRRIDRQRLPAAHYGELAALCAAIASGAGDQNAAGWWWFTANAMDSQAALRLLPELRAKGLLAELPPPRAATADITKQKPAPGTVTLADGKTVAGEPAAVVERPRPPDWVGRASSARKASLIVVDLLVGEDGVARQPVLVKADGLPLQAFVAFAYLRQWRFAPAKVDGKPVASSFQLSVGSQRSDLSASSPELR